MARARALICFVLAISTACSGAPKPAIVPAGPTPTERLAAADRLVRASCLDCLLDAHREYQALRSLSSAGKAATMGAIRTAGLISLRQRELGMVDEGYLAIANELFTGTPNLPAWIGSTLDIATVLGGSIAGVSRPPSTDADIEHMRTLRANREAYTRLLREFAPIDELAAYTFATFMCGGIDTRDVTTAELFSRSPHSARPRSCNSRKAPAAGRRANGSGASSSPSRALPKRPTCSA